MYNGKQFDFMPLLLYCVCDLPARASVQNFKHSTGTSACPYCLHPGKKSREGNTTRNRYGIEKVPSTLRTHADTIQHAQNKKHGVKGYSCLMVLPHFDIIRYDQEIASYLVWKTQSNHIVQTIIHRKPKIIGRPPA